MTNTFDIIDTKALGSMVVDTAMDHMIAVDDEYSSTKEIIEDFGGFTLSEAVHWGFPFSAQVEQDLKHIKFNTENTEIDGDGNGFLGLNQIGDLSFLGVMAGGDWEAPIHFILYSLGGSLRAYLPDAGNDYDRSNMRAWGNGDDEDERSRAIETSPDYGSLIQDVRQHFGIM